MIHEVKTSAYCTVGGGHPSSTPYPPPPLARSLCSLALLPSFGLLLTNPRYATVTGLAKGAQEASPTPPTLIRELKMKKDEYYMPTHLSPPPPPSPLIGELKWKREEQGSVYTNTHHQPLIMTFKVQKCHFDTQIVKKISLPWEGRQPSHILPLPHGSPLCSLALALLEKSWLHHCHWRSQEGTIGHAPSRNKVWGGGVGVGDWYMPLHITYL